MEFLMALVVGVFFAVSTYFMLSKKLLKVVFGTLLISHAANLMLLTSGGLKGEKAPILSDGSTLSYADPIPQALILTAIVIGFGVTAFILVLTCRLYKTFATDDLSILRGEANEK